MDATSISRKPRTTSPPRPTLRHGDRLGDYIITGFAGTGATSYVYRARPVDSFEPVAIKLIHAEQLADPVKRRRFEREAQVMMRLEHPNVVRFHEVICHDEQMAFVMEYIEGEPLSAWRERYAQELDEGSLSCVFVDILRGLGHAHRHGVVHRDLKPANVLIAWQDERYVAKIIDFGVARWAHTPLDEDERARVVGTAAYISPEEVIDPDQVCASSDLYSLGVMLYEAACGRRPFEGMPVQELMQAHVEQAPERPSAHNPALSLAFESVILRTLQKAPQTRFESAPQMIRALELALTGALAMELGGDSADEALVTAAWTRAQQSAQATALPGRGAPVAQFLRRCLQGAFLLLTSTGATTRADDPHYAQRAHHHTHLPLC